MAKVASRPQILGMEHRTKATSRKGGMRRLLQGMTLAACGFALLGLAPEAEAADCRHKPAVCSHHAHKAQKRDTPAKKQTPVPSDTRASDCKLKPAVCHRLAVKAKKAEAREAKAEQAAAKTAQATAPSKAKTEAPRCRHKPAVCSRLAHQ